VIAVSYSLIGLFFFSEFNRIRTCLDSIFNTNPLVVSAIRHPLFLLMFLCPIRGAFHGLENTQEARLWRPLPSLNHFLRPAEVKV